MKTAYLAIQCTDKASNATGTFLYQGDMVAVSPVMPGCVELFAWAAANGWTQGPKDPAHPVGVYVNDSLSGQELFDLAPLGAVVEFFDGKPMPPARFNKKLREWQSNNGTGTYVRTAPKTTANDWDRDSFTLRTLESSVLVINMTYTTTTAKRYRIKQERQPGQIFAYSVLGGDIELAHVWASAAHARAWADGSRYDLRKYGRSHFIVTADGSLAEWDAATAYEVAA